MFNKNETKKQGITEDEKWEYAQRFRELCFSASNDMYNRLNIPKGFIELTLADNQKCAIKKENIIFMQDNNNGADVVTLEANCSKNYIVKENYEEIKRRMVGVYNTLEEIKEQALKEFCLIYGDEATECIKGVYKLAQKGEDNG